MPRPSKQTSGEASPEAVSSPEASSHDADGNAALLSGAARPSIQHGAEVIRSAWEHAPEGPGVYRTIAANGEVLYVGKAKNVRKRIASYMRPLSHSSRIARM